MEMPHCWSSLCFYLYDLTLSPSDFPQAVIPELSAARLAMTATRLITMAVPPLAKLKQAGNALFQGLPANQFAVTDLSREAKTGMLALLDLLFNIPQ